MSAEKKPSKASRAIDLAVKSGAILWHDPDDKPYADVLGKHGERRTLGVRSRDFRTWLAGLMYRGEGSALGGQSATDAVDVLTAIAVYDGDERGVHVRLAPGPQGEIFLDLGDDSWKAIRVSPDGWELVSNPPVRFRRPRGLRPLPEPQRRSEGWDALRAQLNLRDRNWILVVAWLVGTLHPKGPYPLLTLTGEQGSAKTTIGRQIRSIVDPSEAPLRSPPREDRELVIAARNSHVLGFDNLSGIKDWLSDALCRIATGDGYSARELYTDANEVVFSDPRPIILTSIETVVTRGDIADRALAVTLPRISPEDRLPERVIYEKMDRISPMVLGALLDAAATGRRRLPLV